MRKRANQEAVQRLMSADPVLIAVGAAGEAIPGMTDRTILHSGPPVSWDQMAPNERAAVVGAIVFEGMADSHEEAQRLVERGEVELGSAHDHAATSPGTSAIAPGMAVCVVENRAHGNRATCSLLEIGFAYGVNDPETISRLHWLSEVLGPAMDAAVERAGGIELGPIAERALLMGDECHDRAIAASALFTRALLHELWNLELASAEKQAIIDHLATGETADWTFESPWMAACKASLDAAHGVERSSLVTAMSANGTGFGIRVSGLGDQWFVSDVPEFDAVVNEPYSQDDAGPPAGDSTIIDTCGMGGSAIAAAPAQVPLQLPSGRYEDALELTRQMYDVTVAEHDRYRIPVPELRGTPCGIDVERVLETGIQPVVAGGVGHKDPGIGFIGYGIARAPMECFERAARQLA